MTDAGRGSAVRNHRDDSAVAIVAERISATEGRPDLLVTNVWGGYERLNAGAAEAADDRLALVGEAEGALAGLSPHSPVTLAC